MNLFVSNPIYITKEKKLKLLKIKISKHHHWLILNKEGDFIDKNRAPNAYIALLVAKDKIGDRENVKLVEKLDD